MNKLCLKISQSSTHRSSARWHIIKLLWRAPWTIAMLSFQADAPSLCSTGGCHMEKPTETNHIWQNENPSPTREIHSRQRKWPFLRLWIINDQSSGRINRVCWAGDLDGGVQTISPRSLRHLSAPQQKNDCGLTGLWETLAPRVS